MSRGGLMLRSVQSRQELVYTPVLNAVRHGKRPAKLTPVVVRRERRPSSARISPKQEQ
jgi:hypothetical protein